MLYFEKTYLPEAGKNSEVKRLSAAGGETNIKAMISWVFHNQELMEIQSGKKIFYVFQSNQAVLKKIPYRFSFFAQSFQEKAVLIILALSLVMLAVKVGV